jgi:hypothetical protein
MYTNIPKNELLDIINSACNNNYIEGNLKHDILKLHKIIMNQNYFNFEDKPYLQHEGLAMGAPTSPILSELYLQFLENSKIYTLLLDLNISGYFRYVDDILIIYKEITTSIEDLLNSLNELTPNLKFTQNQLSRLKNP